MLFLFTSGSTQPPTSGDCHASLVAGLTASASVAVAALGEECSVADVAVRGRALAEEDEVAVVERLVVVDVPAT